MPLFILLLILIIASLFASGEEIHNNDLMLLLFGYGGYTPQNTKDMEKIEMIQMALYLCIDQYNGNYSNNLNNYLDRLKRFGVKNLPAGGQIDFTAGSEHQRYTHKGWDWKNYPVNYRGYDFQKIWELRKYILISTIEKVFNFKTNEKIKIESFAALLYYTHILRDHEGDSKSTYYDRIPIFNSPGYREHRSGANNLNPVIYTELLYHLPRLFNEQKDTSYYLTLVSYLLINKTKDFPVGDTAITDEEYEEIRKIASSTLIFFQMAIPKLLQNEKYFKRTFNY